jgi:zinc/manganese transport system substrate-binding protein
VTTLAAVAAASTLLLAGCGGAAPADDGAIAVVASTSVYGDIVESVGTGFVEVTSIIDSDSQDPHSYEVSARDELRISRAELIVENGGGYDAFMDAAIEATATEAPVLTAVEFSSRWLGGGLEEESDEEHDGEDHEHIEGFNEHVWYDPAAMSALVTGIEAKLEELAPDADAQSTIRANAEAYRGELDQISGALDVIAQQHAGAQIFVTEPVPLYFTEAAGLENVTPDAFSEAVEEGQDVPPATLLDALELLDSGDVEVVIVNAQTGGAETAAVIEKAEENGIPVLAFTETLPEGQTYLSWMLDNAAQLSAALES